MRSLLKAMLPRVTKVVVGIPTPLRNNTLQAMTALAALGAETSVSGERGILW